MSSYGVDVRRPKPCGHDGFMQLPVMPMLAKSVPEVLEREFLYEPKWDGFRHI